METIEIKIVLICFAVIGAVLLILIIAGNKSVKKYMENQRETGSDKNCMLNFVQQVFGEQYGRYTYAVAWNTRTEKKGRQITTYYLPYIVAFNQTEMQIISYIINDGQILCRNVMPVDFASMKMKYKTTKEGVELYFSIGRDKMPMAVERVIESDGYEKGSRPLGIYQETEVDKLISLLPNYPVI